MGWEAHGRRRLDVQRGVAARAADAAASDGCHGAGFRRRHQHVRRDELRHVAAGEQSGEGQAVLAGADFRHDRPETDRQAVVRKSSRPMTLPSAFKLFATEASIWVLV